MSYNKVMSFAAYIYFMTNHENTVLYIGVTNNLPRRVAQHKAGITETGKSFTARYHCKKLVYYECGTSITDAIEREKQLKNWKRAWKEKLVCDFNPGWNDLSSSIGVSQELVNKVAAASRNKQSSRRNKAADATKQTDVESL
jgi:putative endonuclease